MKPSALLLLLTLAGCTQADPKPKFIAKSNPYEFHASGAGLIWRCEKRTGRTWWAMSTSEPHCYWHEVTEPANFKPSKHTPPIEPWPDTNN